MRKQEERTITKLVNVSVCDYCGNDVSFDPLMTTSWQHDGVDYDLHNDCLMELLKEAGIMS